MVSTLHDLYNPRVRLGESREVVDEGYSCLSHFADSLLIVCMPFSASGCLIQNLRQKSCQRVRICSLDKLLLFLCDLFSIFVWNFWLG